MKKFYLFFLLSLVVFACCKDDEEMPSEGDLVDIEYNPQDYNLITPDHFGVMEIPEDNALTQDGVQLGRRLFYDPILSLDSTMSCSSCHLSAGSFTDNLAVSTVVDNIAGTRSSMSLLNVGYYYEGLFWDGRSNTLEDQALLPVEDPIEMHESWPNVIEKLKTHDDYPTRFRKAFGISDRTEITKELAAKALAQFERIIVSSGNSKFDLAENNAPGVFYSDEELLGRDLYNEVAIGDHPGCTHCHNGTLLTNNLYENNGLDPAGSWADLGRGAVTGNMSDNGKFRVPTLRNIMLTAPYMHDGRFETIDEVLNFYQTGGHPAPNRNPLQTAFTLTPEQRDHLKAFLATFTDTEVINNPDLLNPF